ncbi:MAG: hypothetical protein ACD_76C00044G0002 [uncultured bacterium]|nr:MAG: hypothetical protein ACD_76C00044G0002 [uncultured bacterium]HBD05181.1 hypothetical protein [Candidatus Uhrbacteria bacterium]
MDKAIHAKIHDVLSASDRIILVPDERIDGDSVGSAFAMYEYLKQKGATVAVYTPKPLPRKYGFMPFDGTLMHDANELARFGAETVVAFDCSDRKFVESVCAGQKGVKYIINIDHHATNPKYGTINLVSKSASTCSVVYWLLKSAKAQMSPEMATNLFAGLCFDTGMFSNSATDQESFEIASDLVLCGAKYHQIANAYFSDKSIDALVLWGRAFERIRVNEEADIAVTCITRSDFEHTKTSEEDCEGIVNFLNAVLRIGIVMLFRETSDGKIKASMRTITRDVSRLASMFGGGGHVRAAGFKVPGRIQLDGEKWSIISLTDQKIEDIIPLP